MSHSLSTQLIQNLYAKRDLLKKHDEEHKKIRTALLILGGGMRGASGGGILTSLHDLGLGNVFDVVIGISTGAPLGAYFLGGHAQTMLGTSIFYVDLPPRFIKYSRKPVVDIDFIESIFRSGPKKLDVEAILAHRSDFFIGVTDSQTSEGILLDAKNASPDMITAIKASTAMPGLYGHTINVNGHSCIDGGIGIPFPTNKLIENFRPTDLLIIANQSERRMRREKQPFLEKLLAPLVLRDSPARVTQLMLRSRTRYRESLEYLQSQQDINWGILWAPDDGTHFLTRDPHKLRALAQISAQQTLEIFWKSKTEAK
ncbi:MAG: hypothetical protein BMS9Abin13_369 [Patescibacteria group bacterium]|nr:MAG: hypothetical protein BMS9Abin13_369 [Patescibacteria group bacterium]